MMRIDTSRTSNARLHLDGKTVFAVILLSVAALILLVYPRFTASKIDINDNALCPGCNVILLDITMLRADSVDLLNPEKNITPNIDGFFNDSIIFTDANSPSGQTFISSVAILTATETIVNEYPKGWVDFPNGSFYKWSVSAPRLINMIPTAGKIFGDFGYSTAYINFDPTFDSGINANLDRGFSRVFDPYNSDHLFEQQVGMLNEEFKNISSEPFFLLFHSQTLHSTRIMPLSKTNMKPSYIIHRDSNPDDPIVEKVHRYGEYSSLDILNERPADNETLYVVNNSEGEIFNFTYADAAELKAEYEGQVHYIDTELGRFFELLEKEGILNNTIVVLYAAHGEALGDNHWFGHGMPFQEVIHVPLFIRMPNSQRKIISKPVSMVDLMPTLYEYVGIRPKQELTTVSLVNLTEYGQSPRKYLFGGIRGKSYYVRSGNLFLFGPYYVLFNISDPFQPWEEESDASDDKTQELDFAYKSFVADQMQYMERMKRHYGIR